MNTKDLLKELSFRTSRSSGSGGQHVNKVSTQVELLFDVEASEVLSNVQKQRIKKKLKNRIDKEGILHLSCSESRSQFRNKKLVIAQFEELIREAVKPPPRRKKVKPLQVNPTVRLKKKKIHGEKKALRGKIRLPE